MDVRRMRDDLCFRCRILRQRAAGETDGEQTCDDHYGQPERPAYFS